MNQRSGINGISLLLGELKATVEHLNNNWKMKDAEAARARDALAVKFDELRDDVQGVKGDVRAVKGSVESVQQDVAEMKNDLAVAQTTLDDYQSSKRIGVAVIGDVEKLKEFVSTFERKELRALGAMDVIKRIGKLGWAAISTVATAAVGLLVWWLQHQL